MSFVERELEMMSTYRLARRNDRSVLGTMKGLRYMADAYRHDSGSDDLPNAVPRPI